LIYFGRLMTEVKVSKPLAYILLLDKIVTHAYHQHYRRYYECPLRIFIKNIKHPRLFSYTPQTTADFPVYQIMPSTTIVQ